MDEKTLLKEIDADLLAATAGIVVYLEGKSDVPMFFGLLGRPAPLDGVHQGVLVKGLRDSSTGGRAVEMRVEVARKNNRAGVYGVLDGDGRTFAELAQKFDPPFTGPLFHWKAYCLENLLAKAGWPPMWGAEPAWQNELEVYAPYVALNRVHVRIRQALETLGLQRYRNPVAGEPLLSEANVTTALAKDKDLIAGMDVAAEFGTEVTAFKTALGASLDEAHALMNGKWLVSHLANLKSGKSAEDSRLDWAAHSESVGGAAEVRQLWQRLTGHPA